MATYKISEKTLSIVYHDYEVEASSVEEAIEIFTSFEDGTVEEKGHSIGDQHQQLSVDAYKIDGNDCTDEDDD